MTGVAVKADVKVGILEQFDGLISGNVSDAMERLGLRRAVLHGYQRLAPQGIRMVGTAFTLKQQWKHSSDPRDVSLVRHGEVSRELAQPGDIVVIDTGGINTVATWGENHSMRCLSRGVTGMLTNGATRDADEIRSLGFPIFCRGFSPIKSMWDLKTVAMNESVMLDDVQIRPRDIVFADESGIVIVPADRADEIAGVAQEIRRKEVEYHEDSGFKTAFGLGG